MSTHIFLDVPLDKIDRSLVMLGFIESEVSAVFLDQRFS